MEEGCEFSIVYSKGPKDNTPEEKKHHQIVARVGGQIRKVIKANRDKIYMNLSACRVVDRFYIKRCNKCQKFGHYEKDCQNEVCCGYCSSHDHTSDDCQAVEENDYKNYKCVNCKDNKKEANGHSSLWHKCPSYIEMQSKMKSKIPYYQKN